MVRLDMRKSPFRSGTDFFLPQGIIDGQSGPTTHSGGQELTFSGRDEAVQNQDHNEENDAHSNGYLAEKLIHLASLTLREEGVSTAGDSTGEALILAGLHEYGNDQAQRNESQYDTENEFSNRHLIYPPKNVCAYRRTHTLTELLYHTREKNAIGI
jgi:hypothetical protein